MAQPTLGYVILWVEDLERAIRFYTVTIGFAEKARHGDYVELATGPTTFALVARSFVRDELHLELFPPGRESSEIAIVVPREEVEGTFARAVSAGATAVSPPHEQPWGQMVSYLRDPDGHLVDLFPRGLTGPAVCRLSRTDASREDGVTWLCATS